MVLQKSFDSENVRVTNASRGFRMYKELKVFAIISLCLTQCDSQGGVGGRLVCGSAQYFLSRGSSRFTNTSSGEYCEKMNGTVFLIRTTDQKYVLESFDRIPKSSETRGYVGNMIIFGVDFDEGNKVEKHNEREQFGQPSITARSVTFGGGCAWNVVECQEIQNFFRKQNSSVMETIQTSRPVFGVDIRSVLIGVTGTAGIFILILTCICPIRTKNQGGNDGTTHGQRDTRGLSTVQPASANWNNPQESHQMQNIQEGIENASCSQDAADQKENLRARENIYHDIGKQGAGNSVYEDMRPIP